MTNRLWPEGLVALLTFKLGTDPQVRVYRLVLDNLLSTSKGILLVLQHIQCVLFRETGAALGQLAYQGQKRGERSRSDVPPIAPGYR